MAEGDKKIFRLSKNVEIGVQDEPAFAVLNIEPPPATYNTCDAAVIATACAVCEEGRLKGDQVLPPSSVLSKTEGWFPSTAYAVVGVAGSIVTDHTVLPAFVLTVCQAPPGVDCIKMSPLSRPAILRPLPLAKALTGLTVD